MTALPPINTPSASPSALPHTCPTCMALNLTISTFYNPDPSEDIRLDAWGSFRKVSLGPLSSIRTSSQTCPISRLALHAIFQRPLPDTFNAKSPPEYQACLRWDDSVFDTSIQRARRPVFLAFWSDARRFDVQFAPVREESVRRGLPTTQYFARRLRTKGEKCRQVRSWLDACRDGHGEGCERPRTMEEVIRADGRRVENFLLVDVVEKCLVEATVEWRYVALSYVWGERGFFTLKKGNLERLMRKGSLAEYKTLLPKTIADAMYFVHRIAERYLWVDSLCIVQDDREQKYGLINCMDLIFGGAYLTIIAATSENARAGLFNQPDVVEEVVGDVCVASINLFDQTREKFHHETRAWTFQEQLMSKRQVVFIRGMMMFVCCKRTWREDLVTEQMEPLFDQPESVSKGIYQAFAPPKGARSKVDAYKICVEAYSGRNLSFPEDCLNAFAGITKIIEYHLETKLHYGLPVSHFESALMWKPKPGSAFVRRPGFPSWSWAGWTEAVDLSLFRSLSMQIELNPSRERVQYKYYDSSGMKFRKISYLTVSDLSRNAAGISFLSTTDEDDKKEAGETNRYEGLAEYNGLLQFEAVTASFEFALFEQSRHSWDRPNIAILNRDGDVVGELEDGYEQQVEGMPELLGRNDVIILSERYVDPQHMSILMSSYLRSSNDGYSAVRLTKSTSGHLGAAQQPGGLSAVQPKSSNALAHALSVRSRQSMRFHKPVNLSLFNVMVVKREGWMTRRLAVGWILKEGVSKSFSPDADVKGSIAKRYGYFSPKEWPHVYDKILLG